MTSIRTPILLAIIALGLLGYVLLVDRGKLSSGELEGRKDNALPEFVRERVTRLEIQRKGKTTTLARTLEGSDEEALWRVEAPYRAKADQDAVDALLGELEWVDARRSMQDISAADRKRFGFENPRYRVHFTVGDQRLRLLVGNPSPRGDGVYVQVASRPAAYVVGKDLVEGLAHEPEHYHDKTLHDGVLLPTTEEITFVDARGERSVRRRSDGLWGLASSQPGRIALASGQAITEAVNALDSLRAARYVASNVKDWARYGLERPRFEVRVRKRKLDTGGKPDAGVTEQAKPAPSRLVLKLGAACPGHLGESYLTVNETGTVYCVLDVDLEKVQIDESKLREPRLLPLEDDEVESLRVQRAPDLLTLRKAASGFAYEVVHGSEKPLSGDARSGSVEDWLKALRETRALRFESGAPLTGAKETLTLRIERGKDKPAFELRVAGLQGAARAAPPGAEGGELLVRRADETAPAVFAATALTLLEPSASPFRKLELLTVAESAVRRIEVRRTGVPEVLHRDAASKSWLVTEPVKVAADPVLAPELARLLSGLSAVRFVADAETPAHGFAVADTSVVFEHGTGGDPSKLERASLRLGAEVEGGRYAKLDGRRGVFVVSSQLVAMLAAPLASRSALATPLERIAAVEVEQAGRRARVERGEGGVRSTGPIQVGGAAASELLSRVATVRALKVTGYGTGEARAAPFAQIRVESTDPSGAAPIQHEWSIGRELDGGARHVRRDDLAIDFVLSRDAVEGLLAPVRMAR